MASALPYDGAANSRLDALPAAIRACRICRDTPRGEPLPHEPNPILRLSATARLYICSQAPGVRAHASGIPFSDPSGVRLRAWMGVSEAEFYDVARVGIVPMGFCFPGHDAKGGDLPPRRECAAHWREAVFSALPQPPELILLVGSHAQRWHLKDAVKPSLTETLRDWRRFVEAGGRPRHLPLPHPSWRNNGWLKRNPWFEAEVLPWLRAEVRMLLS
jgi:uracil-DNA glycosylase